MLALLAEGPRNGYALIHDIEARSGGAWRPSPGSIYPALARLTAMGLIRPDVIDRRHVVAITDRGLDHLRSQRHPAQPPWERMRQDTAAADDELADLLERIEAGVGLLERLGTAEQRRQAVQVLAESCRAVYGILGEWADQNPEARHDE